MAEKNLSSLCVETRYSISRHYYSFLNSVVCGDYSRTDWLVETSYTTVSSHSVRSIFELRVVVVEEPSCLVRLNMRY